MQVHAKIQKWGNGLGFRISGLMREIPHFEEGTEVDVEITKKGLLIKKAVNTRQNKALFTEAQLLKDMTPKKAHADELTQLLPSEVAK